MRDRGIYSQLLIRKVASALALLWLGWNNVALAQVASRPSLARVETPTALPTAYNWKAGPVLFRVDASMGIEGNDNVTLGDGKSTPREADLIMDPEVGIDALWGLSKLNTLELHTGLSYTKYLNHPKLDSSSVLASPDSELKLDVYVGNFKITLHDQFSYQENPGQQGALSGVSKFGQFTNAAGLDVLWDMNVAVLTVGYDHTNAIATGAVSSSGANIDTNNLSYNSDEFSAAVRFDIHSPLVPGLEATVASYTSDSTGDSTHVTIGPFLAGDLTHYTKISLSGGYQGEISNGGGESGGSGESNGATWYAEVAIANRLNRFITDQLSFGRENDLGVLSADTETTFVRLDSAIKVTQRVSMDVNFSYSDNDLKGGSGGVLQGFSTPHYQLLTIGLNTGYQLTKKMGVSLGYVFTLRTSSGAEGAQNQDYSQNQVTARFGYQF